MQRLLLLLLLWGTSLCAWPNGYHYRRALTVQSGQVPSTQSYFPALVSLTLGSGKVTTSCNETVGSATISSPCDLIFTSDASGSSLLNWEVESWNAGTGSLLVWVQTGNISLYNGAVIYCFYGKSGVSSYQGNNAAAWDSNYKGVWHLPNGSTLTANDSTTNGNNGTLVNSPAAVAGKVYGGAEIRRNPGADVYITAGNGSSLNSTSNTLSVEFWIQRANTVAKGLIFSRGYSGGGGYDLSFSASATNSFTLTKYGWNVMSFGSLPLDTAWHHVAIVASGAGVVAYVDGVLSAGTSADTFNFATSTATASIGPAAADSLSNIYSLDEMRVSSSARSADWIAAAYNNQSNPGAFWSIGPELSGAGGSYLILGSIISWQLQSPLRLILTSLLSIT